MRRFQTGLKGGPWSPEEDEKLINFIQKHGHENWQALPKLAGLKRCGNSCKSRWLNHLRLDIDIKKAKLSEEDEQTILNPHSESSKVSPEEDQTIVENQTENDEIENFNSSGKGKRVLSPLPSQGESQGRTSTQSADVVSEDVMDFTNEFTDDKIFESRAALIEWICTFGRKTGFKIVIFRSDLSRITFCCERSGYYRNTKKNEKDERNISTKKCGCPFKLQYQKLDSTGDNWKLKEANGVHQHSTTRPVGGRSYEGCLSKEEASLVIEMSEGKARPKDILVELKKRDFNNISTRKDIYNTLQRHKVKKMAESSNNKHNSNTLVNSFPVGLQPHILDIKKVAADANCLFRIIVDLKDFGENGWLQVRKDLLKQLISNVEHNSQLHGTFGRVNELIHTLSYFENRPADGDKRMIMPHIGCLISSANNFTLSGFLLLCFTFIPLRFGPRFPRASMVDDNHFREAFGLTTFVSLKRSLQAMALKNSKETVDRIKFDFSFNHPEELSSDMFFSFQVIREAMLQSISEVTADSDLDLPDALTSRHYWSLDLKRSYVLGILYSLRLIFLCVRKALSNSEETTDTSIPHGSLSERWALTSDAINFCKLIFQAMCKGESDETADFDLDLSDIEVLPELSS